MGFTVSCGGGTAGWKRFIEDYGKFVDKYIVELNEIAQGTRQSVTPELAAQRKEFDRQMLKISNELSPAERDEFEKAFSDIAIKIIIAESTKP